MVGFFVRGLAQQNQLKEAAKPIEAVVPGLTRRDLRANAALNVVLGVLCLIYLYMLFRWWNWLVAAAGLIVMLTRLPDLLFEIKTDQKLSAANMPQRPIHIFATLFMWLALPLLWWGLCLRR